MNMKCNQTFMVCMDRGIDFSVWLVQRISMICALSTFRDFHFTALHFCLLGIPTLLLTGREKVAFQRFNRHQKLNFRCRRDEKILLQCFGSKYEVSKCIYKVVMDDRVNWQDGHARRTLLDIFHFEENVWIINNM